MEGELFQGGVLMHSYLRAVGFSRITKRSSIRQIITDVVETYDEKTVIENYPDGMFAEFSKNYGCDCGITVCGQYDENNVFYPDYYFPFFRGTGITTQESVVIERHADKESFAGAREKGNRLPGGQPLTLSGLAREGKILFPVEKDKEAVKAERELTKNRNHLIAAARNGDEEAMESLTMEDMDTYSMISQRIVTDDIFSIVDSYFMPYGIECDQYSIMGEILDFMTFKNIITGEEICQLTLDCNDMQFDVCINKNDLLGEPKIGRRFKGIIWLQGQLHY